MDFDRKSLLEAFSEMGRRAWDEGTTIEIAVYGGSALMLIYDWRKATKDVDSVFEADRDRVRRLASEIAAERGWPADWLNDGVKGFLSSRDNDGEAKLLFGEFPASEKPGLRLFVPTKEYLFAMKCRAMRIGGVEGENSDVDDIRHLAAEIGISTIDETTEVRNGGVEMTDLPGRPATLAAVAARVSRKEQEFDLALREFLDEFYMHPERRRESIAEEPVSIGDVPDAYLAATAEHLAGIYRFLVPRWTEAHGRALTRAYFAGGLESLKASLTVESPSAFRRRMLFVSKNALDRPRRPPDASELKEPALAFSAF